jgi:hypothetical protein
MYQLQKIVNDEVVFASRSVGSIQAAEYMLKSIASQEDFIGIVDKSGQLVDMIEKMVIWSPGDRGLKFENQNRVIEFKIIVKP